MAVAESFMFIYLLSASFTDTATLNITPIDKLVDYDYSLNISQLIPGIRYNGVLTAKWAVPDSALYGLESQALFVQVNMSAGDSSPISFVSPSGIESKFASALLSCKVENATCANSSVLSADIPITVTLTPGAGADTTITMDSQITQSSGSTALDSLKQDFSISMPNISGMLNSSQNLSFELPKISDEMSNPAQYAKDNPLFSLVALGIVIILTGAYLLKSKD